MLGIDTKIKRGSGELAILALLDQEPLHGYEISKPAASSSSTWPRSIHCSIAWKNVDG